MIRSSASSHFLDSLHVGNLITILGLAHFQKRGHTPIALVGGATGMIGDPSGKSKERILLSEDIINSNAAKIGQVLSKCLRHGYFTFSRFILMYQSCQVGKQLRLVQEHEHSHFPPRRRQTLPRSVYVRQRQRQKSHGFGRRN